MAKAIVIYGSTTGSTEELSGSVVEGLTEGGLEVTLKNVVDANVNELKDYEVIVLGSSTWEEGELQDDFIDFHDKMKDVSLTDKKSAVFGLGDSDGYPDTFCKAVDILEEKLKECGAKLIIEGLKIDGDIDDQASNKAKEWALKIAKSI
ncbi:MAG: flavodoxin [Armatimonadetes bacterium CG07_land_8_20_14_0_80_40_9]|nr:MAG: flavodoxin [Armatimonadetes bacterium CG07_land_8_20_14_0_80_40_9]